MKRRGITFIALGALAFALGTARAGPPAGHAVMIEMPTLALAYAVGANGFVVGGAFYHPLGKGPALHWMPTSAVTNIGGSSVMALSRDGKTLVGTAYDGRGLEQAAIWAGGTSWRLLGSVRANAQPCDDLLSGAFDANADARVIVGLAWDGCGYARAFRWEEATGMVDLGSLSGNSTRANDVSGDGRVIVGWEQAANGFREAVKWVDGREQRLVGPSGAFMGEALATNSNGSLITGTNCDTTHPDLAQAAWTWSASAGVTCYLVERPLWAPNLPYQAYMHATSDDGRVIGGSLSFGLDSESVVWFDSETVFLRDYLRDHGVPDAFRDWYNTGQITDVSPDGRTLVGWGVGRLLPGGNVAPFQGFVVVLPELE